MPLDKSCGVKQGDSWADSFSDGFERAAPRDMNQRVAMGKQMAEPVEPGVELFVDANAALERPYVEAEPLPIDSVERPRPEYKNLRRLMGSRPVQKMDKEVAPAPPPPRKPVSRLRGKISEMNRLIDKANFMADEAARQGIATSPAPAPPQPPKELPIHPEEAAQQRDVLVQLRRLASTHIVVQHNGYVELVEFALHGTPAIKEILSSWFARHGLPLDALDIEYEEDRALLNLAAKAAATAIKAKIA